MQLFTLIKTQIRENNQPVGVVTKDSYCIELSNIWYVNNIYMQSKTTEIPMLNVMNLF